MAKKSKSGRKKLPSSEKKERLQYYIKSSIVEQFGGKDGLLKPEVLELIKNL